MTTGFSPEVRGLIASLLLPAVVAGVVLLAPGLAQADVFHMPDGLTSVEWVTVGNPGNGPYVGMRAIGAVGYTYRIAKYEVTAGQYVAFLNAVAANDPYGLYDPKMDVDAYGHGCQITRHGASGSYTYDFSGRPSGSESDWVNRPVNYISWGDAVRFVNWLNNGQPSGTLTGNPSLDAGLTEDGAYYLNGAMTMPALGPVMRKPGAKYWLPSEDEWFKAAYHKNDGVTANYWDYPTASNDAPIRVLSATGTNNANYMDGYTYTIGRPYYRTEVGAFASSPSPYGTFDQGGNVEEWTDTQGSGSPLTRRSRGGSYDSFQQTLRTDGSSTRFLDQSAYGSNGFRIAGVVPEPGSFALLLSGGLAALVWWRRRTRD